MFSSVDNTGYDWRPITVAVSVEGFQGYLLLLVNCKTDNITIGLSDVSGHFTQISPIIADIGALRYTSAKS